MSVHHHNHQPYNIINTDNDDGEHHSVSIPAVRAVTASIRNVDDWPSSSTHNRDLLDWLSLFFGFQKDNVRNQREHLVLHLTNVQMRLNPPPEKIDVLDAAVLHNFRLKLLQNYTNWCSYLALKPNVLEDYSNQRRELLYVSLYLLIWGESANLRFLPECICFIFHHMSEELNNILDDPTMVKTSFSGENAFLNDVVKPIYEIIRDEVGNSKPGTAPHRIWRNYDDINEYFWSKRCFLELKWRPIDVKCNFFVTSREKNKSSRTGKTGSGEKSGEEKKSSREEKTGSDEQSRGEDKSCRDEKTGSDEQSRKEEKSSREEKTGSVEKSREGEKSSREDKTRFDEQSREEEKSCREEKPGSDEQSREEEKSSREEKPGSDEQSREEEKSSREEKPRSDEQSRKDEKSSWVGKTGFVEQRSFWNLFRNFDRLWVMLVLFLQAAIIVSWEDEEKDDLSKLRNRDVQVRVLTVFFTWSGMRLLQSLLDVGMQYSLVSRETLGLGVRMVLKMVVAAMWVVVFGLLYVKIWLQRKHDTSWSTAVNRRVVNFTMVALVFILPELLGLVLFILPWIKDFLKETNSKVYYMLSWWFQGRTFVGRGLRESLADKIKYTLFWVLVLGTKFCFSYFLQIKPMIAPSKRLLGLKNVNYGWDEHFEKSSNRFAVGLLWLPVVLIYLMDIQIWFSIYSCFIGVAMGLFAHLGEIRNIEQLGLRFRYFAIAIQFNLIPEKQLLNLNARGMRNKFNDAIYSWLKLRCGLGRPCKKLEFSSNQVETNKFAFIWNEIIDIFREEDIISDREHELLELPQTSWNVRVIRWPCFLLCNELQLALSQANELKDAPDKWLWHKICKNEYRRCAVIEAYDSIKHLLLDIIKEGTEEHYIVTNFFKEIDNHLNIEKFTETFNMDALPELHAQAIRLVQLLIYKGEEGPTSAQVVNTLQALYEIAKLYFYKVNTLQALSFQPLSPLYSYSTNELLFENAVELPDSNNETFYRQLRRLHTILTFRDYTHSIPKNLEARRRLSFFSNSLFMDMPRAPEVEKMMAFSVLTPYKDEEVLYSEEQLRTENEDGVSILYYLQTIYADEWRNFMQRMRLEGMVQDEEIWTTKLRDLRLWASYRGQTLSRTVRGMMYYYRALKLLAFLDSVSEMDISEPAGSSELSSMRREPRDLDGYNSERSRVRMLFKGRESGITSMKYTYVVSCHIYGMQKAKKDPCAEDILYLMKNNEALRVAYVDEVSIGRDEKEKEYYSVLVKYDRQLKEEVEIYRIKLPGDPLKLGEGKPENQNHAIIFTRGDAVQTIDMNQDNYFEEALKMRNLLEEFRRNYGIRKPTILGVREHIFTAAVSSLGWFMSAQETSFVTLVQRVLANPLKVRMHYGHPDVFDRFWFLTRGGISKASRVINISEDIFAGFNCTLRGGNITHHEYIQVGKGREVGLNQVSIFEAKVASGNGEQVLSRDVYRLGQRLDFFRMLSFFYGTVGFFFNTMMVILTVYAFLWGQLYLALSGIEASSAMPNNNAALDTIMNQQFIVQLGLFTALPMLVESSLENGFLNVIWEFLTLQLQLSSVFYTFSLGTRAHYFGRTILHGGARYQATGRGFVVQHTSFAENYRLFSRSHFVKAIELGLILLVYKFHSPIAGNSFVYIAITMECWFLVVSWIMAPFVFNPSGFDWLKTVCDFDDFMKWIWYRGSVFTEAEQSWERWWYKQHNHLRKTGIWGNIVEIILDLRFFFFQYGLVYRLNIAAGSRSITVYLLSWIYVFVTFVIYVVIAYVRDKYAAKKHIYYRLVQFLVIIVGILVVIALPKFTHFKFVDIFTSLLAFIPTGWGLILIAQVLQPFLRSTILWETVVSVARLYDLMFGLIVIVPVALLSWLPGFQSMQTRILFNEAFTRGLRIFQILTGKKHKS